MYVEAYPRVCRVKLLGALTPCRYRITWTRSYFLQLEYNQEVDTLHQVHKEQREEENQTTEKKINETQVGARRKNYIVVPAG